MNRSVAITRQFGLPVMHSRKSGRALARRHMNKRNRIESLRAIRSYLGVGVKSFEPRWPAPHGGTSKDSQAFSSQNIFTPCPVLQ
jgi:hypothetical protein